MREGGEMVFFYIGVIKVDNKVYLEFMLIYVLMNCGIFRNYGFRDLFFLVFMGIF